MSGLLWDLITGRDLLFKSVLCAQHQLLSTDCCQYRAPAWGYGGEKWFFLIAERDTCTDIFKLVLSH